MAYENFTLHLCVCAFCNKFILTSAQKALETAKPARPLSIASASAAMGLGDHSVTTSLTDEVLSDYAAATSSSSPPPPLLPKAGHRMGDSADLDQTLVGTNGQAYPSASSRPQLSNSRLPSNDDSDDIDVRASNVASTAACLLSQLSGQLQQLNTTGPTSNSNQIPVSETPPADAEFDLPAPPSPKQLHYL